MKNVYIIDAHHPYPFAPGKLNTTLTERATQQLTQRGYQVRTTQTHTDYVVEQELANHQWADAVIVQFPLNWMGVPWSFKKYMDDVYTAGMAGALCQGDGRTSDNPKANYGRGGTLKGTYYMMSATANAPAEAFNDPSEFFAGNSLDDLLLPMHMNFKFFAMQAMPTFACFDVMKNPDIDTDLARFDAHIAANFKEL